MKAEITEYYDNLADIYDDDRFSNTYGKYIHQQELTVLKKYLSLKDIDNNLDLACGTGRFLHFAKYGVDLSSKMIQVAKQKFPDRSLTEGDAENLDYPDAFFENIISFHLFMHLNTEAFTNIQKEVARICKPGARFVFDVPSEKRRKLLKFKTDTWHGGFQISKNKLKAITHPDWEIEKLHGVAFFPIHRIPKKLRRLFILIDTFLCNSIFREYSSHLIFILRKK